jgi:eukaryotic-like serine/threonine-protein kinase
VDQVIAGRYELERQIGRGGMSSVFRARDRLLERTVALKILHEHYTDDADYVERFRREARSAAQLSHPNIVTVIDRGEHAGRQFIVFEYVDGQTLKDLVRAKGPLPIRRAVEISLQIARALAYAHSQGLVHRDVKPQNVLLNGDGQAKVTDFGIARSLDVTSVTMPGTVLGTSDYIAPEQATGEEVEAHSDVYSLGVVLFELLTGEVPFPSDNFVAAALRHVNEPPPSVVERRPEVPLRLAALVERALAKDPDERYRSMDALIADLEVCRQELPEEGDEPDDGDRTMIVLASPEQVARAREQARTDRASRRPEPVRRRRLWPALLLLIAIAAAVVGALGYLASRGGTGGSPSRSDGTRVPLHALASYDPFGTSGENDSLIGNATDGNPTTYWPTESYRDAQLNKPGVGLLLDAGRTVDVKTITIRTDTGGFTAQIIVLPDPTGRRTFRSEPETVNAPTTTITLRHGLPFRYYVVWITALGGHGSVHLNEVTARG